MNMKLKKFKRHKDMRLENKRLDEFFTRIHLICQVILIFKNLIYICFSISFKGIAPGIFLPDENIIVGVELIPSSFPSFRIS